MSARDRRPLETVVLTVLLSCGHRDGTMAAVPIPSANPDALAGAPSSTAFAQTTSSRPRTGGAGDVPSGLAAGATASQPSWPALVRDEQWEAAWRAIDSLPETEKSTPEVRYVRARIALERGDAAAALPLLEGLESGLPLLVEDVARCRAEAKLSVGPFAEAGEWFAARLTASAQLDAARAFEKAKDARRARAAADRVLAMDKRTRGQEAEARALRIRVADPPGDSERADERWIAVQGADLPVAGDALALLGKIDPAHPLSAQELLTRARILSEAARTEDALHAIESIVRAPGADKVSNLERSRARGMVLYHSRKRYPEAARVLRHCAAAGGQYAAEDSFHAARALSRADRDEEAIVAYEAVEKRFPTTPWADQAAFLAAYLRMLHGQWRECVRGFERYARAHPAADDVLDARRDGGLCALLDGDAKAARTTFEHLVDDEPDPLASARMADMAALAALHDGDRIHALARWTDVALTRPLSWAALVGRARLAEAGAELPPAMDARPRPGEADGTSAEGGVVKRGDVDTSFRPRSGGAGDVPSGAIDPRSEVLPPLAVALPPPADFLLRVGLDADAELALRDRESAVTSGVGARAPEALCAAYGQIGRARRRYQIAQALPSALFASAPVPRTRWAWECAFPSPYADVVRDAEANEKLPKGLLWAVMRQESAFDPDAVSPAHAVGLMQLLPETARPVADELALPADDARLTSPSYAIRVAARLLHKLMNQFHGDVVLAVAAYNAGAEPVERWLSRSVGMQMDTFVERIPYRETRDYVTRVMGNLARYGYLALGEEGVPHVSLELKRR